MTSRSERSSLTRVANRSLLHALELLRQARAEGNALKADLAEDAINQLLDHYEEYVNHDQRPT